MSKSWACFAHKGGESCKYSILKEQYGRKSFGTLSTHNANSSVHTLHIKLGLTFFWIGTTLFYCLHKHNLSTYLAHSISFHRGIMHSILKSYGEMQTTQCRWDRFSMCSLVVTKGLDQQKKKMCNKILCFHFTLFISLFLSKVIIVSTGNRQITSVSGALKWEMLYYSLFKDFMGISVSCLRIPNQFVLFYLLYYRILIST